MIEPFVGAHILRHRRAGQHRNEERGEHIHPPDQREERDERRGHPAREKNGRLYPALANHSPHHAPTAPAMPASQAIPSHPAKTKRDGL